MAKITMEFDTKDKTLLVKMDGKDIENVSDISAYQMYSENGKFMLSIRSVKQSEEKDMTVITNIVASENGEIKKTQSEDGCDTKLLSKALFRRL